MSEREGVPGTGGVSDVLMHQALTLTKPLPRKEASLLLFLAADCSVDHGGCDNQGTSFLQVTLFF